MLTLKTGFGSTSHARRPAILEPLHVGSTMIRRCFHAVAVITLLIGTACTAESHGEGVDGGSFYDGRVLEVIVPFGPGGGTDIWARMLVPHLQSRIGDRVFFTVDSSSLNDAARQTLLQQARWLNDNPDYRVIIEGHADERGTREYNVALGARRANAVVEFLNAQGVANGRMRAVSYGKERPIEACPEQRCWDINRRAVTVVSLGSGV